jgi:hypothetical protein
MIIKIKAKIGNRFKNSGIQEVNRVFNAEIRANGFIKAQRTSIIQIIRRRIGKKNLYNIKNGMNWSSSFMMPSKISLPKLGFKDGLSAPGGINICSLFRSPNKSSGKSAGNGIDGTGKLKGIPNPGMDGPLGPDGDGRDIGEQGIVLFIYPGCWDSPVVYYL